MTKQFVDNKIYGSSYKYSTPSSNAFSSPIWGGEELTHICMILFFSLITYGRDSSLFVILILTLLLSFLLSGGYGSIWCALSNLLAFYYLYKY